MVHVAGHQRAGQCAAVPHVTVSMASTPATTATVVAVAGQGPVRRQPVAGQPVWEGAVARKGAVAREGAVSGQRAVPRMRAVAGYRTVAVAVTGVMAVRVRVPVVPDVATALLLLGYFLYGQETVLPHLYPLGHVPHGSVFCENQNVFLDTKIWLPTSCTGAVR